MWYDPLRFFLCFWVCHRNSSKKEQVKRQAAHLRHVRTRHSAANLRQVKRKCLITFAKERLFFPSNGARLIDMCIASLCTFQQPTLLLQFVATSSSDTCRRRGGDGRAGQFFPVVPFGTSEGLPSTHPANMAAVAKIKCGPSVFRIRHAWTKHGKQKGQVAG